jgi:hypothetical protein
MIGEVLPGLFSRGMQESETLAHERRSVGAWVHETLCAVGGHSFMIRPEHNRLFLRCEICGHETPGWTIETRRPPRRTIPH